MASQHACRVEAGSAAQELEGVEVGLIGSLIPPKGGVRIAQELLRLPELRGVGEGLVGGANGGLV